MVYSLNKVEDIKQHFHETQWEISALKAKVE